MRKFLKFVHDDNVYCKYYEVVYILFHTGMRISEFCGLTIKDVDLFCGIAAMYQYLSGKDPMPGDIFRFTRLGLDPKVNREYDFYVVSHAWPVDLYNNRYTSWQIAAEQTNLNDVPDIIKNYRDGL